MDGIKRKGGNVRMGCSLCLTCDFHIMIVVIFPAIPILLPT